MLYLNFSSLKEIFFQIQWIMRNLPKDEWFEFLFPLYFDILFWYFSMFLTSLNVSFHIIIFDIRFYIIIKNDIILHDELDKFEHVK